MRNCLVIFLIIGYCGQVNADIYKKSVDANGIVIYTNKAPAPAIKPIIKTPALATTPTMGYFYKYQDTSKRVIYTDKLRTDVPLISKTKVIIPATTPIPSYVGRGFYVPPMNVSNISNLSFDIADKNRFNNLVSQVAARHQVDEKLVHAVIQAESAYRANAVSTSGAVGLMQLMPATASRFGVIDSSNPEQNIDGGTRYLRHLLDLFPNNLDLAIAAYNAGENSVLRHNNSIPPYPETQNYVKQVMALYKQKS
jgi:hypothetical protein